MRNHEMFPAGSAADAARRSEGDVSGAVAARARVPRSTRCTTRAAICERRFVVLLEELLKKKRSFLGRIRLFFCRFADWGSAVAFPKRTVRCQLPMPRGHHTATRAPHGAATAERRVEDAPGGSAAAWRSLRTRSRRAVRARRKSARRQARRQAHEPRRALARPREGCRRRHRATAVTARAIPSRKPGERCSRRIETRTSPRRTMGSSASRNPARSACASRVRSVSRSVRSAPGSRRAETRSARG